MNKKVADMEAKDAEEEIIPVYSEPDDADSQKRPASEQPGPSRKKKKTAPSVTSAKVSPFFRLPLQGNRFCL